MPIMGVQHVGCPTITQKPMTARLKTHGHDFVRLAVNRRVKEALVEK
jgi:hypothetical protein